MKLLVQSRKQVVIVTVTVLLLYILSYTVLSITGGYRLVRSGHFRPILLASPDTFVWQPLYGECYSFMQFDGKNGYQFDILGLWYFPLIRLDQTFVHASAPYIVAGADGEPIFLKPPRIDRMHPESQRIIKVSDAVWAKHQPELDAAKERGDSARARLIRKLIQEEIDNELNVKK